MDDDAALRLALDDDDDDLRALAALGGADDAELGDRPSALLDRRLADEFGAGALFPAACLLGGAGSDDDMEQMLLLSDSDAFLSAHFGAAAAGDASCEGPGLGLRAELTARHFLHATGDTGAHPQHQQQQQRLVLLRQAIASATAGSASAIFNMPPRYFESAASSPQKRRVHRRTFGERQQTFAFSGVKRSSSSSKLVPSHSHHIKQEAGATANDENRPPVALASVVTRPCAPPTTITTPDERVYIKEEVVAADSGPIAAAAIVEMDDADVEPMDPDEDVDMELAATAAETEELFRAFTPVQEEPAFLGFRSISDDHRVVEGDDEAAALRTPLRRCLSSPAEQHQQQQLTPLQSQGLASRSMSPADAFEKVAGVVQVARDSPARLGKFEWRIRGADASPGAATGTMQRKRPTLAAQLGSADAASAQLAASCDRSEDAATSGAAAATSTLPPRYFRGGTSSPQKRRAHSTTFGAFARSFSFTGAAPRDV